jgi:hypothetical protein
MKEIVNIYSMQCKIYFKEKKINIKVDNLYT